MFPKYVNDAFVKRFKPGQWVVQRFDPRLYCFASTGQTTLVAGAIVEPHFGWSDAKPTARRFVVAPRRRDRSDGEASEQHPGQANGGRLAVVSARAVALDSSYAEWSTSRLPDDESPDCDPPEPAFELTGGSDVNQGRDALVSMRFSNPCKETVEFFFMRTLVGFRVRGPEGKVTCKAARHIPSALPNEYTYLRPGRSRTVNTRIVEMCPLGTFDEPGLYEISAVYRSDQDGQQYGLDAFTGKLRSDQRVLVRVRKGDGDLFEPKRPRPRTKRSPKR